LIARYNNNINQPNERGNKMNARFEVQKTHSDKKPWMVIDHDGDPAEDAVMYFFTSKKKADEFKVMLDDEKARGVA
jgi:hypothetical protein